MGLYRGSRVRSPPVPVVLSVYQRGSLLDGLAMYLSRDTKKSRDNESTHVLHNFWTFTHRGELPPFPPSWRRHCFSLAYTCHQLTMTLYTGVSQKCSRTDRYTTTKSIEGYQLHPSHTATSTTLTYGPITIAIRARFEYDSSSTRLQHATTRYEMRTIRVRFERDTTSYEELCAFEQ